MRDNTGFRLWEQAKKHFSVAIYPIDFTKWTPAVKIPLQNGTGRPTEPVLLHALWKKKRGWRSFSSCVLDCIIKCLFEFTCHCNGVGVNIGCQTGANNSLKIHKGEQSPDVIHVYRKLIFTVLHGDYPWTVVWERVQGHVIF